VFGFVYRFDKLTFMKFIASQADGSVYFWKGKRNRRKRRGNKNIPANVIAVGNPCKVLREITERDREYYYKDKRFDQVQW